MNRKLLFALALFLFCIGAASAKTTGEYAAENREGDNIAKMMPAYMTDPSKVPSTYEGMLPYGAFVGRVVIISICAQDASVGSVYALVCTINVVNNSKVDTKVDIEDIAIVTGDSARWIVNPNHPLNLSGYLEKMRVPSGEMAMSTFYVDVPLNSPFPWRMEINSRYSWTDPAVFIIKDATVLAYY